MLFLFALLIYLWWIGCGLGICYEYGYKAVHYESIVYAVLLLAFVGYVITMLYQNSMPMLFWYTTMCGLSTIWWLFAALKQLYRSHGIEV